MLCGCRGIRRAEPPRSHRPRVVAQAAVILAPVRAYGFAARLSASDDVRDQQLNKMTNRELIGVILKSPIDMLVSGSAVALSE